MLCELKPPGSMPQLSNYDLSGKALPFGEGAPVRTLGRERGGSGLQFERVSRKRYVFNLFRPRFARPPSPKGKALRVGDGLLDVPSTIARLPLTRQRVVEDADPYDGIRYPHKSYFNNRSIEPGVVLRAAHPKS